MVDIGSLDRDPLSDAEEDDDDPAFDIVVSNPVDTMEVRFDTLMLYPNSLQAGVGVKMSATPLSLHPLWGDGRTLIIRLFQLLRREIP